MKKLIYCVFLITVSAVLFSSCEPEPEPRAPKTIEDLGPIETREQGESIPYSYTFSEHTRLQVGGNNYSVYPSAKLYMKGEMGVDYRYIVTNMDDEPLQSKVFDILTDMEIDPLFIIEQFLNDPQQVGHDFNGTIVVSSGHKLEVEQAQIYNDGTATDHGYGFQIRKNIEDEGLVTSEQKDVIELRNYAFCSDFYLVIYELDTGNIISYTFLYTICHGTGPGSEGGSSGSDYYNYDWGD